MELKKNPKSDLENHNKLFFLLGIALALLISYVFIEWKTFDRNVSELAVADLSLEPEVDIPVTLHREKIQPPPPLPAPSKVIKLIDDKDDASEDIFESTEVDEDQKIDIKEIETAEMDEPVEEDIPYVLVEEVPTFPDCKGSNAEKKQCFQEKIRKIVGKFYNTDLANELGLSPGKKRVYVQFTIDKNGDITDIKARGPHARLEKEAIRVVQKIPKLLPGKQRTKPVRVKYTLPITLIVQ